MSELRKSVRPETKAIIWLTPSESPKMQSRFTDLDYLLDGLLTATFSEKDLQSTTVLGQNYGENLFVFVAPELASKELKSFLELMEKNLVEGDEILVVDDRQEMEAFRGMLPKALGPRLRKLPS